MTIELLKTITLGLLSFTATNLDDFLLILMLFSIQTIPVRKIVIGQYIGMLGILMLSYSAGSAGSFLLSPRWIGIFGILPLIIGLADLFQKYRTPSWRSPSLSDSQEGKSNTASLQIFKTSKGSPSRIGIFTIAILTLVNGGDNIAVYSGLFAKRSKFDVCLLVTIYMILTAIWCIGGFFISSQGKWSKVINRFNTVAFPYFMIAIGLSILFKLI